jgi:exodeoxyribonuclease V alpha subunit
MKNTIVLHRIYRQEEGNGILDAARAINAGSMFGSNEDVKVIFSDQMLASLKDIVKSDPEKWRTLRNQIISPARKSDIGTPKLNGILQTLILPNQGDKILLPRHKWQDKETVYVGVGDKVVCNNNCYDLRDYHDRYSEWEDDLIPVKHSFIPCPETKQVLNGEVGIVSAVAHDGNLEVDFGDRVVEIPAIVYEYSERHRMLAKVDNRKHIELAYALTTHKCQGSEYEEIAYIMASQAFFSLSRQNFYTALTRARKKAAIYTDQRAFRTSLRNVKTGAN